ncbi:DUF2254 domain-containing protein [Alkalicoccus halolimnae]|uniref:DUF2254 domain-containing protein n=1 Tax=Alkalicoccus halolimnae TaxID=1667239 RepID=A0AAJ8LTG4_9BACI|nr:DUF2254 domain-containing protein [Alkalicoccus halolimnae]
MLAWLPESLRKYFQMSRRERKYEMSSTLWYMPFFYISLAIILVIGTLFLDLATDIDQYAFEMLRIDTETTQILVSTLIGGILTLSAFTLNSLLVFLTTFSGQFSPRMLLNFVAEKQTQHALGIFNGSFVYVLLVFLFIGSTEREVFVAVPLMTIFLAFFAAVTFIYFINHATTWMQVHNITDTMKKNSQKIVKHTLSRELEIYRTKDPGNIDEKKLSRGVTLHAPRNGYIQLVDYRQMIECARKDNIIVQFHFRMGDYILEGNKLLTYWGEDIAHVKDDKYSGMIRIGHKELELQDIHVGMHKLSEIAIKSIGNNDPKTVINAIHQMSELMLDVVSHVTFTPYLVDESREVRLILLKETFESYVHKGFGYIRYYAARDHLIIGEMVKSFSMLAESIDEEKRQTLWDFAYDTSLFMRSEEIYRLDRKFLLQSFEQLAITTDNIEDYKEMEDRFLKQI